MKRRVTFCLALGLFLGLGEGLRQWLPAYVVYQPSTSLPKGWYRRSLHMTPLTVGDFVCLDVPASMRTALPPEVPQARLLKRVAGLAGDTVCWTEDSMDINGTHYPFVDDITRLTPAGCVVIEHDEMIIVGTHRRSFDSRYVGVVPRSLIHWRAVPLWTWEAP